MKSFTECREGGPGASAVGRGLQGLVGGVTAGVTGVVRAPLQGYNDGSGVIAGKRFSAGFGQAVLLAVTAHAFICHSLQQHKLSM